VARSKHAINQANHARMMVGLGFKAGLRNYTTYLRKLEYSKRWNKEHNQSLTAASNKYYHKAINEIKGNTHFAKSLYAIKYAAEKLQKRKDRANEARKELFRLQNMRPNRCGGRSTSPLTIEL